MNRSQTHKQSSATIILFSGLDSSFNDELDGLLGKTEHPIRKRVKTVVGVVHSFFESISVGLGKRRVTVLLASLLLCLMSMGASLLTCNTCVEYFPHALTTSFTRVVLGQGRICGWNQVCHTYLTVPEDISTSMIVNFNFFGAEPAVAVVVVDTEPITFDNSTDKYVLLTANCFHMEENTDETRYQCWADVTQLEPSSTYFALPVVYVYDPKRNDTFTFGNQVKFRTGPSADSAETIQFVTGGDMMMARAGTALSKFAATQEPLFAVIGGDIAYANGDSNCYRRWDKWFSDWNKNMLTPTNYSVPILACIGNHEAGGFMMKKSYIGSYLRYFPHELGLDDIAPQARSLSHSHVFGNHTIMLSLDSWIHTHPQEQVDFIDSRLREYAHFPNKLAVYHAAMYPSKLDINKQEKKVVHEINKLWKPLFDHHNLTMAFENHFHLYKVTHPIYNDKIANVTGRVGTIYVGDGAWGLTSSSYQKNESPLIKEIQNKAYVDTFGVLTK
jgi:hypothetical protein